jgi:S-adenosyl-L-methionine hydrolase (adenosine-forming)
MTPLVAITTDFGQSSPYVAELKAVLYSALPEVRLVDVTHAIPPQSIRHAEVALRTVGFAFPLGSVHLVVVDPGVGTARRPIAVLARGMTFVGPDNGVLAGPMAQPDARAVVLDRPELFRSPVSPTFHGRDLFAPVAAELAAGLPLDEVGTAIDPKTLVPSLLPAPRITAKRVTGMTLVADVFGNLTTNVPAALVDGFRVTVGGRMTVGVRTYGEGPANTLLSLAGSDGFLEVAMREASATRALGAEAGLEIVCDHV